MDDLLAEFEHPKERSPEDKARRRRLAATVGIVGLSLVALGSLSTGALFTDQTDVTSADVVTGSVDITTNPNATIDFSATNMAPGDSAYAKLQVVNSGSLALRYSGTGGATGALGAQLRIGVYLLPTSGTACNAGTVASGSVLAAAAALGAGPTNLFGSSATGQDSGDQVLAAGNRDGLCVVATLPLSTGNGFQNTTTTVNVHFDAEQTANNP